MLAAIPGRIVRGMVRLEAGGQALFQANRIAEFCHHAAFLGDEDQILHAADLGDGGDDFRREAGGERAQRRLVGRIRQKPIAKSAHGQMGEGGEGLGVVIVDDEACHLVAFVRHDGIAQECGERRVGQGHLRRHALFVVARRDPGQIVAGARRAGFGEQVLERVETICVSADGVGIAHDATSPLGPLEEAARLRLEWRPPIPATAFHLIPSSGAPWQIPLPATGSSGAARRARNRGCQARTSRRRR